jgi:hypothetical protein
MWVLPVAMPLLFPLHHLCCLDFWSSDKLCLNDELSQQATPACHINLCCTKHSIAVITISTPCASFNEGFEW